MRVTDRKLQALRPDGNERTEILVDEGLGFRALPSGKKTWMKQTSESTVDWALKGLDCRGLYGVN